MCCCCLRLLLLLFVVVVFGGRVVVVSVVVVMTDSAASAFDIMLKVSITCRHPVWFSFVHDLGLSQLVLGTRVPCHSEAVLTIRGRAVLQWCANYTLLVVEFIT